MGEKGVREGITSEEMDNVRPTGELTKVSPIGRIDLFWQKTNKVRQRGGG